MPIVANFFSIACCFCLFIWLF